MRVHPPAEDAAVDGVPPVLASSLSYGPLPGIRKASRIILAFFIVCCALGVVVAFTMDDRASDVRSNWVTFFSSSTRLNGKIDTEIVITIVFAAAEVLGIAGTALAWAWSPSSMSHHAAAMALELLVGQFFVLAFIASGILSMTPFGWSIVVVFRRFYWRGILGCVSGKDEYKEPLVNALGTLIALTAFTVSYPANMLNYTRIWTNSHMALAVVRATDSANGNTLGMQIGITVCLAVGAVAISWRERAVFQQLRERYGHLEPSKKAFTRLSALCAFLRPLQAFALPVCAVWLNGVADQVIPAIVLVSAFVELLSSSVMPLAAVHFAVLCNDQLRVLQSQLALADHNVQLMEAASAARRAFVSYVAHELRNPLQTMRLGIEELTVTDGMPDKGTLRVMDVAGHKMGNLLDEMLAVDKMEAGMYTLEMFPMSLTSMIDDVLSTAKMRTSKERVALELQTDKLPDLVLGDQFHISQILMNFVSNAFKFVPKDGTGKISVRVKVASEKTSSPFQRSRVSSLRSPRDWTCCCWGRSNKVHVEAFSTVGDAQPNELAIEIPEHRTSASAGNSTIFVPQKEEDQLQWLPCEASARTIYKVHLKGLSQEAVRKGIRVAPSSTVCSVTVPTDRVVKVRFEVEDNGCGISAADQQKLFQAFVQINAAETQGGKGTGLGLYICKEIAARHGGAVGVISEVRVRTIFWFEASFRVMWQSEMSDAITPSPVNKLNLTISSSAPHALYKGKYYAPSLDSPFAAGQQSSTLLAELSSPSNPVASASTQTMRIGDLIEVTGTVLIVDDDASQRLLLTRLIRRWTTATLVIEAANGVEAVPLVTQYMSTLSLIMMDFNMPGYDCGDKVCANVRGLGYTGTIAGLTGDGDNEKQRFLKAGANCVIHKPLDRSKFNDIFKTNSAHSLLGDGSVLSVVS